MAFAGLVAAEIIAPSTASADPFTPGIVTLAGSGASGFVDGSATSASFSRLASIAVDPSGEWLYAIDTDSLAGARIRKISTATGAVTTFAVGGILSGPVHLAVDSAGDVWVSVHLSSSGNACDADGLFNDAERGIVKYPAGGGSPVVMLSGLGCANLNSTDKVTGSFGFDASGENLFFANVRGSDNGYIGHAWLPNIRSVPLSALPLDDGYVPGTTNRPAGHPVTDWGGRGALTRSGFSDLDVGSDGKVYVLWGGTDEGAGDGENLYRLDAPGSLTLVIPGRVTSSEHDFAFSKTTSSTYSMCGGPINGNGCSGNMVVRRAGFGSGEPFHLAGGDPGYAEGYPGQLNVANREEAGVALSPDDTRLYVADAVNRRIRMVDIPPDPNELSPDEIMCGCNAGEKNLHSETVGHPISVATGNMTETVTDVSVAGRGVPLRVSRSYNSAKVADIGLFGKGWDSNLDTRLLRAGSEVVIEQENGASLPFSKRATGEWAGPPRVTSTLTEETDGSWTLVRNKSETITFDANGRLSGFKDRNGYVTAVTYPSTSEITVTDPGLRALSLTLDSGRVREVEDSTRPGRTISYGYTNDRLTSVTSFKMNDDDASPVTWGYGYDTSERLSLIVNPLGHTSTTHYDTAGRVDYQLDFAGKRIDLAYGGSGANTWTEVTHPANNAAELRPVERYEFNDLLTTSHTTAYGTAGARTWTYDYDPNLMAVTAVRAPGDVVVSEIEYDPATGNVTRMEDGEGRVTQITDYDPFNNPEVIVGPDNVTTTNTYDANGNLLTSSRPIKVGTGAVEAIARTTFVRSATHPDDVIEVIEPRHDGTSVSTDFVFNAGSGLPSQVTDAKEQVTKFEYDASGHLTRVVEPLGTSSGNPSDHDIVFEVNDFGLIEEVTDQLGEVTSYRYDKAGHRILTTDPQESIGVVYDPMGRVTRVDRPGGTHLDSTYFDDGSLRAQIDADAKQTTYEYNLHGEVTTMTDPLGRATTYGYDTRGRTTSRVAPGGSCPSTLCTTYGYNNADELTSVLYSDPLTPDVTYTYDTVNMRKTMTDGAGTSTWQWDSLGRLRSFTDPVTGPIAYDYTDPDTLLPDEGPTARSVIYATGKTISRGLDDTGRLEALTGWIGGTTDFVHDDNGNLDTINTAATSGIEDDYDYDRANRMTNATLKQAAIVLAALNWTRDLEGMVNGTTGSGALSDWTDDLGYTSLDMLGSTTAGTYGYDAADNLDQLPDGRRQNFNAANELCYQAPTVTGDCTAPAGAATYGYDASGNRTHKTDPDGSVQTLSYDEANRLTTALVPDGAAAGQFHPVTPTRILSTPVSGRTGSCYTSAGAATTCDKLTAGETIQLQVTGTGGVPADAGAVVVNVAAVGATSSGYLRVYPVGITPPGTSTLNFPVSSAIANTAITKIGANGRLAIYSTAATEVIVDVVGWYAVAEGTAGSEFQPLDPSRIVDTRDGTGSCPTSPCGQLAAVTAKTVQVTGDGGIPASGVETVVLNVTATGSTSGGYITAYQSGTTRPATSNINFTSGQTISALVTVPVSSLGRIDLWSTTAVHVVIDVAGYYTVGDGTGAVFVPAPSPTRILSTPATGRTGTCYTLAGAPTTCDKLTAGETIQLQVTGAGGVPANATAVSVSLASSGSTVSGVFTAYNGSPRPLAAQLTYAAGQIVASATIVPIGPDGRINLYSSSASEMYVDVTGWFAEDPGLTYSYTYSGDGLRRTKTSSDGTITNFTWDRSGGLPLLLAETIDAPGGTTNDRTIRYLYGPTGHVLADITTPTSGADTIRWYHHDQLGSTAALTNNAGATIATFNYSPYGELVTSTGTATTPIGWAGEYRDEETGYTYLRARHYDPATGQFLTRDPMEAITRAPYGYAGNNPINRTDPTGLCWPDSVCEAVGGAVDTIQELCWDSGNNDSCDTHLEENPGQRQAIINGAGGLLNGITLGHGEETLSATGRGGNVDWDSGVAKTCGVLGVVLDAPLLVPSIARGAMLRGGAWISAAGIHGVSTVGVLGLGYYDLNAGLRAGSNDPTNYFLLMAGGAMLPAATLGGLVSLAVGGWSIFGDS